MSNTTTPKQEAKDMENNERIARHMRNHGIDAGWKGNMTTTIIIDHKIYTVSDRTKSDNATNKEPREAPRLTYRHKGNFWFEGVINGHPFTAKIYEEPSHYGINEGRISKLQIQEKNQTGKINWGLSKALFNYDRGEDISTEKGIGLMRAIVAEIDA